jgi:predicted ester cyclase
MKDTITKRPIEAYFNTHDTNCIAEDAVFIDMSTGNETRGKQAIAGMLQYLYHIAFDAKAIPVNTIVTDNKAVYEASFEGKHIGEFAGIAPKGANVKVPLCVSYDLKNDLITKARIYMANDVLMRQLQSS